MKEKTKTLNVSGPYHNHPNDVKIARYRVEKITNSLEFTPGDYIDKSKVQDVTNWKDWVVVAVPAHGRP